MSEAVTTSPEASTRHLPYQPMSLLDPPSETSRWTTWETLTLLAYMAVVAFAISQHVPWADEAQAWMLAHDVTLATLLTHSLHYEGTPGLWHVFLKLLQTLHLSFTAARWISGAIATAGIAVLLRYAPFPRILRLLLPFSFFLAYQDAVIARSYVLFTIFAFPAAAMLRSRRPRPLALALVLGLMANISLHAALASGALAIVAFFLWRRQPAPRARQLAAVALLLVFWAGAIATMIPASDIDFTAGNNVQRSTAKIETQLGMHVDQPAPLYQQSMAGLQRVPVPIHTRRGVARTWNKLARILSVITYPLSTSRLLALLLATLVILQAARCPRRQAHHPETRPPTPASATATGPLGLTPWLLMVAVFTSLYIAPRHVGMVFTAFLVTAWLTWPTLSDLTSDLTHNLTHNLTRHRLLLERATTAVFALVLILQIGWTAHALYSEHTLPYSPDRMAADYLQAQQPPQGPGRKIAGYYYYSVGPLLYFDHNLYLNQPPHRYWYWSTRMRSYSTVQQTLAQHPDFIVLGGLDQGPEYEITRDWAPGTPPEPGVLLGDDFRIGQYFRAHGYHDVRLFCGHSWIRQSYSEQVCLTILERDDLSSATPPSPAR
jgi:hypothetical protein